MMLTTPLWPCARCALPAAAGKGQTTHSWCRPSVPCLQGGARRRKGSVLITRCGAAPACPAYGGGDRGWPRTGRGGPVSPLPKLARTVDMLATHWWCWPDRPCLYGGEDGAYVARARGAGSGPPCLPMWRGEEVDRTHRWHWPGVPAGRETGHALVEPAPVCAPPTAAGTGDMLATHWWCWPCKCLACYGGRTEIGHALAVLPRVALSHGGGDGSWPRTGAAGLWCALPTAAGHNTGRPIPAHDLRACGV